MQPDHISSFVNQKLIKIRHVDKIKLYIDDRRIIAEKANTQVQLKMLLVAEKFGQLEPVLTRTQPTIGGIFVKAKQMGGQSIDLESIEQPKDDIFDRAQH